MFNQGIIGDIAKLLSKTKEIASDEVDLSSEGHFTEDDYAKIDNVAVPMDIPSTTDKYIPSKSDAPIGSAGNPVSGEQPEAQMGACDNGNPDVSSDVEPINEFGMNIALEEGEEGGMVVDENPMKTAMKVAGENSIEKIADFFEQWTTTKPKSGVKYDIDGYDPKNSVSDKPIRKIPKHW